MFDDLYVPVHSLLAPDVPDAHESNDFLLNYSDAPESPLAELPYRTPSVTARPAGALDGFTDA